MVSMKQHRHSRRRRLASLALVGGLALSLSGCLRMHVTMEVNQDDTVDGTMVFAIQDSVLALMGDEADGLFDEMDFDNDEGVTVADYAEDGYTGKTYTFARTPIAEFSSEDLAITRDGDEFVVDGTMDMTDMGGGGEVEGVTDSFDMRISFTFPGEVTESNGEVDGTTVTWTPVAGDANPLTARAKASSSGSSLSLPVVLGIVAVVVVLGAAVLLLTLNRRRQTPAPADESAAPAGAAPVAPAAAAPAAGAIPPAEAAGTAEFTAAPAGAAPADAMAPVVAPPPASPPVPTAGPAADAAAEAPVPTAPVPAATDTPADARTEAGGVEPEPPADEAPPTA